LRISGYSLTLVSGFLLSCYIPLFGLETFYNYFTDARAACVLQGKNISVTNVKYIGSTGVRAKIEFPWNYHGLIIYLWINIME